MNKSCIDRNMGSLLHAYELGMLSEQEKDSFETHLIECDFCYAQLKEFAPRGAMLISSEKIREQLEADMSRRPRGSFGRKIIRALWPEGVPVIVKPAVLTVILLLMLYPSYLSIRRGGKSEVTTVQEVALLPTRSQEAFEIAPNLGVVLSFLCPASDSDGPVAIVLRDPENHVLYEEEMFSAIDNYRVGRLFLPPGLLSTGTFTLAVRLNDSTAEKSPDIEYIFEIVSQNP